MMIIVSESWKLVAKQEHKDADMTQIILYTGGAR